MDVYLTFDVACAIIEQEHVGAGFPTEGLKPAKDGNGMKMLALEEGIVFEGVDDLVDGHWDDSFIIDGFLFFSFGVHGKL